MKFSKYLENQSVPEWRKAYICYKGLKKDLKAVERVTSKGYTISFLIHLLFV
jgi:SPX domain protein involved in polyphosphate accumulation